MARKHNDIVTNGTSAVKTQPTGADILHMDDSFKSDQLVSVDPKDDPDLQAVYAHADEYLGQIRDISLEVDRLSAENEDIDRQVADLKAKQLRNNVVIKEAEEKIVKTEEEASRKASIRRQLIADLAEGVKLYGDNLDRLAAEIIAMQEAFEQLTELANKVLADP